MQVAVFVVLAQVLFIWGWVLTEGTIVGSTSMGFCCTYTENPHALMDCLMSHTTAIEATESPLHVISYYTNSIIPYAAYAFATNAAFSSPTIPMSILTPNSSSYGHHSQGNMEADGDAIYFEMLELEITLPLPHTSHKGDD